MLLKGAFLRQESAWPIIAPRALTPADSKEHPMSTATITTISTEELRSRFAHDVGLHLWNVLTDEYFKGELIPGSRRVPTDRLGEALRRSTLASDARIVVYCAGPTCPASRQAAEKLAAFGYTHVEAYEGGLEAWKQAGHGVVGTGDR
jgi:rhodanese-related sulfurtransferase